MVIFFTKYLKSVVPGASASEEKQVLAQLSSLGNKPFVPSRYSEVKSRISLVSEMPRSFTYPFYPSTYEVIMSQTETMSYFDHVPHEILCKIVSFLSPFDLCTLAMVSQRFQRVCGDKRLWKSVSLTNQEITFIQMEMLITSSFPIEELDLSWSCVPDACYHRWQISSDNHMTLEKLNLTEYGCMPQWDHDIYNDVLYILERCRMKELILDSLKLHPDRRLMEAISEHENLEMLSMERTNFRGIDVADIQMLFNSCSRLKELNLSACCLSTQELRAICDNLPETVEKLVLVEAIVRDVEGEFKDNLEDYNAFLVAVGNDVAEACEVLFRRVKNLKYFGTPYLYWGMPAIIDRIVQHHSLETLRLSDYDVLDLEPERIVYVLISVLEQVAPKLKKIDIFLTRWLTEEEQDLVPAQIEKLREASIGIDVEVYDTRSML